MSHWDVDKTFQDLDLVKYRGIHHRLSGSGAGIRLTIST
jgi:hypothetical protein